MRQLFLSLALYFQFSNFILNSDNYQPYLSLINLVEDILLIKFEVLLGEFD